MYSKKCIDSNIDWLKKMLADPNNELSSEQQSKLKKGIRDLKRLQREKRLTHPQIFAVVNEIVQTVYEILKSGSGE
jgi:hypothetical protein